MQVKKYLKPLFLNIHARQMIILVWQGGCAFHLVEITSLLHVIVMLVENNY